MNTEIYTLQKRQMKKMKGCLHMIENMQPVFKFIFHSVVIAAFHLYFVPMRRGFNFSILPTLNSIFFLDCEESREQENEKRANIDKYTNGH